MLLLLSANFPLAFLALLLVKHGILSKMDVCHRRTVNGVCSAFLILLTSGWLSEATSEMRDFAPNSRDQVISF